MKKQIFLTALALSISSVILAKERLKDQDLENILSGKIAYLENNYQESFKKISLSSLEHWDSKTYWQACHSAFMTGNAESFFESVKKQIQDSDLLRHYIELINVYEGKSPGCEEWAAKISTSDWAMMFQCISPQERLRYLDRIYTHQWLEFPSARTFVLECLVGWGLMDDAYELATLDFPQVNEQWLSSCELNFSYAQLKEILNMDQADLIRSEPLKQKWYASAIAVYADDPNRVKDLVCSIKDSSLSPQALSFLSHILVYHGYDQLSLEISDQLSVDANDFINLDRLCLAGQYQEAQKILDRKKQIYSMDSAMYWHQAKIYYYTHQYEKALQCCKNIEERDQTKESAVLQACIMAQMDSTSALPFLMNLYRQKKITHREITAVQVYLLDLQGAREQSQGLWSILKKQEQSNLKSLSVIIFP